MSAGRHLLIYHFPLGEADGTTVVLHRLFAPCAERLVHLSFREGRFPPPPDIRHVAAPGFLPWPFLRGARLVRRLYPHIGLPLRLALSPRMRRERSAWNRSGGTVLVNVYDDATAARALALLRNWGIRRYVLMIVDLLDDDLPSARGTPALHRLLREAAALITISERLGGVLATVTGAPQFVFQNPCGFDPDAARLHRDGPFRAVATGALYDGKTAFFQEVFLPGWRDFAASRPSAELLYAGADGHKIPEPMRPFVRDIGRQSNDAYAELLAGCSVGVLPVGHGASDKWRYSVPARLTDYLAAGLSIVAPPCQGTATADFLDGIPPETVTLARDAAAVTRCLTRLHDFPAERAAAAAAANGFARAHLSLRVVRPVFMDWLARHSAPGLPARP